MDLESRQGDREHLDRTFRAAHTLKGAAGMVGLRAIADFTHKVEAVLDEIRGGRLPVSREAITILLRAKDYLGFALDEAIAGRTAVPRPSDEDELLRLKAGEIPTPAPKPAPRLQSGSGPTPSATAGQDVAPREGVPSARTNVDASQPDRRRRYRIEIRPR